MKPYQAHSRRVSVRGSSLIEVLVVLGIVAVLAGLLLPLLARARDAARSAACQSNLRQIHILTAAYEQTHAGRLFAGPDIDPDGLWTASLGLAASEDDARNSVLRCPSIEGFANPSGQPAHPHLLVGEGSATLGWTQPHSAGGDGRRGSYGWNTMTSGQRLNAIRRPAQTFLFADSARPMGRVSTDEEPGVAASSGSLSVEQLSYLRAGGFRIERHGTAPNAWINAVFADGRVERVSLRDINRLGSE